MPLVVFTGGVRSGKSGAAQRLARRRQLDGARVIVAVFGPTADTDAEMVARIGRHRDDRPPSFETLEPADPTAWLAEIPADAVLVIDCLGTLLGRVMEAAWDMHAQEGLGQARAETLPDGFEADVTERFETLLRLLGERAGDTIVVTNEVGDGIVPAFATGRLFRDLLGGANRTLVRLAASSYWCIAGRLVELDGLPLDAHWPTD